MDEKEKELWRSFNWDDYDKERDVYIKSQRSVNIGRQNRLNALNPERNKAISEGKKKYFSDPENRQAVSKRNAKRDPAYKEKLRQNSLAWAQSEKGKQHYARTMPKLREAHKEALKDPEFRKKIKASAQKKANDPKWKEAHAKAMEKRNTDPKWKEAHAKGMEKRSKNKQWRKNMSKSAQKRYDDPKILENYTRAHCQQLETPDGVFVSLKSAGEYYNDLISKQRGKPFRNGKRWVQSMMKKQPDLYYYITWEEYKVKQDA